MTDIEVLLLLMIFLVPWSYFNDLAKKNDLARKLDPDTTVCVKVSKTLYTNVGTVILDKDGKPIPCTPTDTPTEHKIKIGD